MIKKYSFDDELDHTEMVLQGLKTRLILPAPPDPGYHKFQIVEDKLIFLDFFNKVISSHKIPLIPCRRYKIMRPYRDLRDTYDAEQLKYYKGKYGWRDKRAVPLNELRDTFGVYKVKYKPIDNVLEHEWLWNGIFKDEEDVYHLYGNIDAHETDLNMVFPVMMMNQFHYVPKYVYVYEIGVISDDNPYFPKEDDE